MPEVHWWKGTSEAPVVSFVRTRAASATTKAKRIGTGECRAKCTTTAATMVKRTDKLMA